MTIAVLAVQGAFIEHEKKLQALGADVFEIRQAKDLERHFDGLVLPGGESTVQGKLLRELGLFVPLHEEIGLCGPEDWDWSNEMNWPFIIAPNITTVKIPATQIGSRAAALLLEKLEGPECPPKEILLPCVFYERASTIRMR